MPNSQTGKFATALGSFRLLESSAAQDTFLHRLSPSIKITATFFFILTVVSFSIYELSALLIFFAYPVLITSFAKIPLSLILKRSALALPFVIFAGGANLFFDKTQIQTPLGFEISGGIISFTVLVVKTFLCVSSALILASTTSISEIAGGLRRFKLPCVLILQFLLTCRYIEVLIEEAQSIFTAYKLRAPKHRFVKFSDWSKLAGQLFLRSLDRAERIYSAMCCRGFCTKRALGNLPKETLSEFFILLCFLTLCLTLRFFNFSQFLGGFFYD